MKKLFTLLVTNVLFFCMTLSAHAALLDMGDGTIYDSDKNIYWLKNANLSGNMDWYSAMAWADSLEYAGYDDWRLPSTLRPDSSCGPHILGEAWGYGCTGSEMGHLFYEELHGTAAQSILTSGEPEQLALFDNILPALYWSSAEYEADDNGAWGFNFSTGDQPATVKGYQYAYAWAVRDGSEDVKVPEPGTIFLLSFGLFGMLLYRRNTGLIHRK